jgi:hypothetical protein
MLPISRRFLCPRQRCGTRQDSDYRRGGRGKGTVFRTAASLDAVAVVTCRFRFQRKRLLSAACEPHSDPLPETHWPNANAPVPRPTRSHAAASV